MTGRDPVLVLDIRGQGPDMSFLDKLDKRTAHRLGLVDRVVLVDNTASLVDNHDRYQRLVSLSHVRAVVCVAVGPFDVELRQSAALGAAGVTLWVGDEWGSRWAGGSDRPRPITEDPPHLGDLTAALRSPQVFDRVVDTVRQVPHQTVCPGLAVVRPTVSAEELRALRAAALADLVGHDTAIVPWPPAPTAARADDPIDPARDAVAAGSPIGQGRTAVRHAVRSTLDDAARAPGVGGLLTGSPRVRPEALGSVVDAHLADLDRLLDGLDRAASGGRADVPGVPPADPPRHPELATGLRELVRGQLRAGRSLTGAAEHLRRVSNQGESSGEARTELAALRAALRRRLTTPAPPALWPVPGAVFAAAAALTSLLVAWLTGEAVAALGIGVLWTLLVGLFVLRLPGRDPEHLAVVGAAPVGAAVGGLAGSLLPDADVPGAGQALVAAAMVAVTAGVVIAAWRRTVTRWVRALRLDDAGQLAARIESIVDERVRDHVRSLTHRRRLVDATRLLASGCADLARCYTERADASPDPGAPRGPVPELSAVLRADLVELAVRALDRYFTAIAAPSPLAAESQALIADAARDLRDYDEHLDVHGIHSTPPMVADNPARESLRHALWQRSAEARAVLRSDGRDELVQLCQTGDIRALNVAWRDVAVLRFAPAAVQEIVLGRSAAPDVVAIDGDLVGVLRLVPLGAGRVSHVHPTTSDPSDGDRE